MMAAARSAALTVGSREARALASFISCAWLRSILRGAAIVAGMGRTAKPAARTARGPHYRADVSARGTRFKPCEIRTLFAKRLVLTKPASFRATHFNEATILESADAICLQTPQTTARRAGSKRQTESPSRGGAVGRCEADQQPCRHSGAQCGCRSPSLSIRLRAWESETSQ